MPGASLLTLLDDIASMLDDVAPLARASAKNSGAVVDDVTLLTKVAAKKTSGVLGDDLALNAQQVTGVGAERELPVVWAVARGSLVNKAILVPGAIAISALAPWAVVPLLMIGGAYLCYEGFEKIAHRAGHPSDGDGERRAGLAAAVADPSVDLVAFESDRIKGAVRTDFILSAEIVAITLGTVAGAPFPTRVLVLSGIALLMTVGVYGLVAAIVRLDDLGILLSLDAGRGAVPRFKRALGAGVLRVAPLLMKGLAIAGTAAMFLVGGGILVHGVPSLHHAIESLAGAVEGFPGMGSALAFLTPLLLNALVGVAAGALLLGAASVVRRIAARARAGA